MDILEAAKRRRFELIRELERLDGFIALSEEFAATVALPSTGPETELPSPEVHSAEVIRLFSTGRARS